MAITTNAVSVTSAKRQQLNITPWQVNATSADATGCEEVRAAPGAGNALCVAKIIATVGAAITLTVGSGETQKTVTIDAGPAVDKPAGHLVGIPATGHGLDVGGGENITIAGTNYYDGAFVTHADTTDNEIVITKTRVLDNAAAVDKGGGLVGIPMTAHGLNLGGGDSITIAGSVNYNATYVTHADTTENEIVITAAYVAEVFTGAETVFVAETFAGTETIACPDSYDTVETIVLGPFGGAADTYAFDFTDNPIQLATNKALTIDASGAGTVTLYVEGFTRVA